MAKGYKVWAEGKEIEVTVGGEYFAYKVGVVNSKYELFGEKVTLIRATKTQLVFETKSGTIVKTGISDLDGKGKSKNINILPYILKENKYIPTEF